MLARSGDGSAASRTSRASDSARAAYAPPRVVVATAVFVVFAGAVLVMVHHMWVVGGGAKNSRN